MGISPELKAKQQRLLVRVLIGFGFLMAIVTGWRLGMTPEERAQEALTISSIPLADIIGEIGCDSPYSEDKKADIFSSRYANRWMQTIGEVTYIPSGGEVGIKILPTTLTYDLLVELKSASDGYSLTKGQRITIRYLMRSAGGCVLPFAGDTATVLQ